MIITLDIDKTTIREIEDMYSVKEFSAVNTVVYDIFDRYLNIEYFDPELQIEKSSDISLDLIILKELKDVLEQIFTNNDYGGSLFSLKLFEEAISKDDFIITEYQIGRIYTLAEIYFHLLNKPSPYAQIIELISSYDINLKK